MVYIYKKIIGKSSYYYLRASERKGKRIISKDIAYLGSSIEEVKRNLDKLTKYKLKRNFFLKDKTDEVEACQIHFNEVFKKLDELTKKEIFKNYVIEFAYNTASIEGNTINLEEARNLLNEGITPKNKTLREVYDLQNTEKVFFDLLNVKLKKELGNSLIIEIHDKLLENIDERKGYRTTDIRVVRSNFDASPGKYVRTDMDLLLKWYNKNENKLSPLVLALLFHHKFEKIHPFMDGNGRAGRMIMNFILLKKGWPPAIIHKKTRKEYLEAMRKADTADLWKIDGKKYSDLIDYGINEFIETYWNIFL